ncbi:hypothetical protein PPERSA_09856 [Pseudocohnilembus persalinus]|uniref:Uncharacterized protein n=1 Tax=Pseudocohnilembus persalinus TaxID=266149 RepID=A0A0V0QTY7_PSEPJ|nr:hypothetical protein PPERSA_09856 [Pseudocohnilembus persalinus]|eukprot:KRX05716.1 hypothetical protein PPERSA_09856 [Pseudocohnilembus persalinus]
MQQVSNRPVTALNINDYKNNQYIKAQNNQKNRPLTSINQREKTGQLQQQNNRQNTGSKTHLYFTQKPKSAYFQDSYNKQQQQLLLSSTMSQSRASIKTQKKIIDSSQYQQNLGDEGERLDSQQIQLQNLIKDINDKRPSQQRVPKEKLFEEAVNLNNKLSSAQRENQKLNNQLKVVEQERSKHLNLIMKVEDFIIGQKGKKLNGSFSQLFVTLKKELEDLNDLIVDEQEKEKKIKKKYIFTKQQEFEIQLANFKEQSEHIRNELMAKKKQNKRITQQIEKEMAKRQVKSGNQLQQQSHYEIQQQQKKPMKKITEADILKQQVYDQRSQLAILQEQNDLLVSKYDIEERKIKFNLLQQQKLKQDLDLQELISKQMEQDKNSQIENERKKKEMQKELEKKQQMEKNKSQDDIYNIPKKQEPILLDMKQQLILEKEQELESLEKKKAELDTMQIQRAKISNKQFQEMSEKKAHLKTVISNLEYKLEQIEEVLEEELQTLPIDHMPNFSKGAFQEMFTITNDILNKKQDNNLKKDLFYRMRIKNISFEQASRKITPDKIQLKGHGTIYDMVQILQRPPFLISNNQDALLVARYLVEDNQNDFYELNYSKSQNLDVIRSIFKNLIGYYKLYSEDEEFEIWENLSKIIQQYNNGLQQESSTFKPDYEETGILSPNLIQKVFRSVIEITPQQLDYIYLRLFEFSNKYQEMDFKLLPDIFKPGGYLNKKQRLEFQKMLQVDEARKYANQYAPESGEFVSSPTGKVANYQNQNKIQIPEHYLRQKNKNKEKQDKINKIKQEQNEKLKTQQDKLFKQNIEELSSPTRIRVSASPLKKQQIIIQ